MHFPGFRLLFFVLITFQSSGFGENPHFPDSPVTARHLAQIGAPDVLRAKSKWLTWQAQGTKIKNGPNPTFEGEGGYKETQSDTGGATAAGPFYGGQIDFVVETAGKPGQRLSQHLAQSRLYFLQYSNLVVAAGAEAFALFHQMQARAVWLREIKWIKDRQEKFLDFARNTPRSSPQSRLELLVLEAQGREWAETLAQGMDAWWGQSHHLAEICGTTNQGNLESEGILPWPPMPNPPPPARPPAWVEERAAIEKTLTHAELALARSDLTPNIILGALFSGSTAGSKEFSAGGRVALELPLSRNGSGSRETFSLIEKQAALEMEMAKTEAEQLWLALNREWARLWSRNRETRPEYMARLKGVLEGAERDVRLGTVSIPLYLEVARAYAQALNARQDILHQGWGVYTRLVKDFQVPQNNGGQP